MKKSAALLSPIIIASLLGTASAQGSIELVEHYTDTSAPSQTRSSEKSSMNTALRSVEKLNAAQGSKWQANFDRRSGAVKTLYGSRSKSYGSDPEKVAKSFLKESSEVFGLGSDLANMKTLRVDKEEGRNHVRFQQMYKGIPVNNAIMLVHSNKNGQVTMAQSSYASEVAPVNSREVSQEKAVKTVMDDLQASVQSSGASFGEARAEEMVESINDKYYFIWKVTVSSKNPFGFWVYFINAQDAKVLYKNNEIVSLRTGYGRVYKNNQDWLIDKLSIVRLPSLFTEQEDYFTGGLWGKHADIYDDESDSYGDDPYAPNLKFLYNPYGREKPWFDAVNIYYRMNRVWGWWKNNVITKYGPKKPDYFYTLSIPVGINVKMCNAYYSPELLPNYPPGFAFGDENTCGPDSEDFTLDDGVVMHEFAHAMMEWSYFGRQFGGAVNGYGRAMGEGNADWFAYLFTKNPKMGDVVMAWSEEGYGRNLDNTRMYPADVDCPDYGAEGKDEDGNTITVLPLPEEHYTGEIFGGYLYDLTQILKKKALPYVYRGMYYFSPAGGFRNKSSDFYDAILAQAMAEKDRTGKLTNTIKVWGTMSSRGLLGNIRSPYSNSVCYFPAGIPKCEQDKDTGALTCECFSGSDKPAYFSLRLNGQTTLSTESKFLKPGVCNEYPIDIANSGVNLKVTVAGIGTVPSIKLYNASAQVIANSADNTSDQATLNVPGIPASSYTIMTCAGAANTGKYTIQVTTTAQ